MPAQVGSIENEVLVGRDDTLFLAGGAHHVMDLVLKRRLPSQASIDAFTSNIQKRRDWAAKREIPYVHLVFPDKQSIVPERWSLGEPARLADRYLEGDADLPILYPADRLKAEHERTISLVDTHVTHYGSVLVAAELSERLTGGSSEAIRFSIERTLTSAASYSGDLGSKLSPPVSRTQIFSADEPPGAYFHNELRDGNNGIVDIRVNANAPVTGRLVIFGDSFGRDLARFFPYWFQEVIFLRTPFFHPELAGQLQPRYLLTESVERYLESTVSDEERPNFFLYPHFKSEPYRPPQDFLKAFSAVLSGNRPPYQKFRRQYVHAQRPQADLPQLRERLSTGPMLLAGSLADPNQSRVLEDVTVVPSNHPVMMSDQDHAGIERPLQDAIDVHGTYLATRRNVLLFGPSFQVDHSGAWVTESRAFGEQFLDMYMSATYQASFPGTKPDLRRESRRYTLDSRNSVATFEEILEPLFLGTPLEPDNWGRWVASVLPRIAAYKQLGGNRRFFCHARSEWQRAFLAEFGIASGQLQVHDPGRAYLCRDVMSVEQSVANMTVSGSEREVFAEVRDQAMHRRSPGRSHSRIFVSRKSFSRKHASYRVLQNEAELEEALRGLGFTSIEPELLSIADQVHAFAAADQIVCLGGAALYNTSFCKPGTSIITVESSRDFLRPHSALLSTLGHRYGIVVGRQDLSDPTPVHKKWSVDVSDIVKCAKAFFGG